MSRMTDQVPRTRVLIAEDDAIIRMDLKEMLEEEQYEVIEAGDGAAAVQLDAVLVVPLDIAVDFLAVAQHDDHGSLGLHLLLIVKILGVGLLGRRGLFGRCGGTVAISVPISVSAFGGRVVVAVAIVVVVGAIEGRTDQLAIREAVLIGGLFGWYGVDCIFQIAPPARRAGKICHNT